jgi:hypothetical protein
MSTMTAAAEEWISGVGIEKRTGIPRETVRRLEQQGLLTVRRIPGCRPLFLLSSVLALIEESTRERSTLPRRTNAQPVNEKGAG